MFLFGFVWQISAASVGPEPGGWIWTNTVVEITVRIILTGFFEWITAGACFKLCDGDRRELNIKRQSEYSWKILNTYERVFWNVYKNKNGRTAIRCGLVVHFLRIMNTTGIKMYIYMIWEKIIIYVHIIIIYQA